jgi:hypothetical protein
VSRLRSRFREVGGFGHFSRFLISCEGVVVSTLRSQFREVGGFGHIFKIFDFV